MTVEDGMFLACDARVKRNIVARKNISSAVLGGEGLFDLSLRGTGVVAPTSPPVGIDKYDQCKGCSKKQ